MRASSLPRAVWLDPKVRAVLMAAWQASAGAEPCGGLLGEMRADGSLHVAHALQLPNRHKTPVRGWALEPQGVLVLRRVARETGLAHVGYWHGHLVGEPSPGQEDWRLRDPIGPALHVIVGRGSGDASDVRAWWAGAHGFAPLQLAATCSSSRPR